VSATQKLHQPVEEPAAGRRNAAPDHPAPQGRRTRRRWLAVGVLTALAAAGAATALMPRGGSDVPAGPANAPITLPASVEGLARMPHGDLTGSPSWRLKARQAGGVGVTVVGQVYGKGGPTRSIRIVAGRTDLTGRLDLTWAADAGTVVGDARCTHDTKLTASSQPQIRPTVLVCWRTTPTFSVYSLIIDPRTTTPVPLSEGATAVDLGWQAAREQG
jgi:hypothetical protein